MKKKNETSSETIDILEVHYGYAEIHILGTTPLICNRMSQKSARELLMPKGRLNAVDKATRLKHDPRAEYRDSPYTLPDGSDTLIAVLATAPKKAMMTAALDLPGTKKAQIGRLVRVEGSYLPIFGVPQLHMATVIQAGPGHTPDIRTRAIIPEWAARVHVRFVEPLMKGQAVLRLLAAAGMFCGIGDWRQEKGSGDYGLFNIVEETDPEFQRIIAAGGREAQIEAIARPACYDNETASLLAWFDEELDRRRAQGSAEPKRGRKPRVNGAGETAGEEHVTA